MPKSPSDSAHDFARYFKIAGQYILFRGITFVDHASTYGANQEEAKHTAKHLRSFGIRTRVVTIPRSRSMKLGGYDERVLIMAPFNMSEQEQQVFEAISGIDRWQIGLPELRTECGRLAWRNKRRALLSSQPHGRITVSQHRTWLTRLALVQGLECWSQTPIPAIVDAIIELEAYFDDHNGRHVAQPIVQARLLDATIAWMEQRLTTIPADVVPVAFADHYAALLRQRASIQPSEHDSQQPIEIAATT